MTLSTDTTAKARILVVEDDAVIGIGLANQLTKLGYQVIDVVPTGEQAIRTARSETPDLVLMDIKLKGNMDGIEAAGEILAHTKLPVIFLTAHEDDQLIERAKKAQPFGYLVKPYGERELHRTIQMALYKADMERKLQESEAKYRDLVELAPQFVYEIDTEGRLMYVNEAGRQLTGYSKEDYQTVPVWALFSEESRGRMPSAIAKILAGEKSAGNEYELVRKDGAKIPIVSYSSPIVRDNQVVGIRGIAVDLTDRKRMELKLAASEERFRTISECLPNAVLVIKDGKIVKSNPAVKHILGYQEKEIEGKYLSVIYPPETKSLREEILKGVHLAGSVFEELQFLRADGSKVLADSTFAAIPWDHDSAVLITLRDCTERIAVQQAIRQAKEEWERTFHAVPDLIAIIDSEHRITRINRAMAERLGIDLEQAIGLKCHEVIHGMNTPICLCPHAALLDDGQEHSAEVFGERLSGTFHVTASPLLDSEGSLAGCVHVARDITEKKLAEERQKELMEELRRFTYFVSHDLRGPLTNVIGFSRELQSAVKIVQKAAQIGIVHLDEDNRQDVSEALEERIPESLRFIGSSVLQMDHLISAIMVLSRTERRELFLESVNMNELVNECLNSLAYQISTSNTKVTIDPLPEIVADRTAMEQVFANLIGNAIKYLEPGRAGTVTITGCGGEETLFRITDNGRGIETSDLSRIFQVFQRAGKSDVPGEGMGLAHVRTLIRRHGGRIWCESEPGVRSTFAFTICKRLHPKETPS